MGRFAIVGAGIMRSANALKVLELDSFEVAGSGVRLGFTDGSTEVVEQVIGTDGCRCR